MHRLVRVQRGCHQKIDIKEYAEAVLGYIYKSMEDICITKCITVRVNEKPWMTAEVQALLKARDSAFKSGDTAALRTARANLNKAIRLGKKAYEHKIQGQFQDHRDTRTLWQGVKSVTDYKTAPQSCDDSTEFLNELNNYFGQFEALNNTPAAKATPQHDEQVLCLDPANVCRALRRINPRKAADPDQIPGCVLKG